MLFPGRVLLIYYYFPISIITFCIAFTYHLYQTFVYRSFPHQKGKEVHFLVTFPVISFKFLIPILLMEYPLFIDKKMKVQRKPELKIWEGPTRENSFVAWESCRTWNHSWSQSNLIILYFTIFYLFIYFWLCWVFVAAFGLSLVVSRSCL